MSIPLTDPGENPGAVPPGTPPWITRVLIERTISVWQRFYSERLTAADAVEMLITVSNLFGALRNTAPSKGR